MFRDGYTMKVTEDQLIDLFGEFEELGVISPYMDATDFINLIEELASRLNLNITIEE